MNRARRTAAAVCLLAQGLGLAAASASPRALPRELRRGAAAPADSSWVTIPASAPESRLPVASSSSRRRWGLAASGAGLAAGVGLAAWLKSEADDRYDLYLATADPAAAREHRDAAQRYDRASLLGWMLAQASFVGLVYFLIHEEDRPLVPVRGEPLVRPAAEGLEVGVTLWP